MTLVAKARRDRDVGRELVGLPQEENGALDPLAPKRLLQSFPCGLSVGAPKPCGMKSEASRELDRGRRRLSIQHLRQ